MVELPTACGKHVVYYPGVLAEQAMQGQCHAFLTACECGTAYLIVMEVDGAHCKAAGEAAAIEARYDALAGEELVVADAEGVFAYKQVTLRTRSETDA